MFTEISALIPTRCRIERLKTLLGSFEATTDGAVELVFRVDEDDAGTIAFIEDRRKIVEHIEMLVGPRLGGYESLPIFFNEMLSIATGDVLLCGNDDMVFKTPGWASAILAEANKYPDGLFNIGVSTHNEAHYPFSVTSRKVADTLGFLWDPRIFWGDIFLRDVMAHFGRLVPLPTVQIDHDWVGYVPDETFVEGNQQRFLARDAAYWGGPHASAVREAVEKLQVLHG